MIHYYHEEEEEEENDDRSILHNVIFIQECKGRFNKERKTILYQCKTGTLSVGKEFM